MRHGGRAEEKAISGGGIEGELGEGLSGLLRGEGPSYRERQKGQVQFRECGEEMMSGSMEGHIKTQHVQAAEERWSCTTSAMGEEPQTYRMAFPDKGGLRS